MKKKFVISMMFFFLFVQQSFAHKEWVHQYLVWESYDFLVREKGYGYEDLRNHIGFGFNGHGSNNDPWATGFIGVGAWREDKEDIVFRSGGWFGGWTPSSTHFWNADYGDESQTVIPFSENVPNSWTKARRFLFGGDEIVVQIPQTTIYLPNTQPFVSLGNVYKYTSLVDLYNTGNYQFVGYINTGGTYTRLPGPDRFYVMDLERRKKICYGILGRVAHLLADNGVPAHTHNDIHVCNDDYELWMGGNDIGGCDDPHINFPARQWNKYTAHNQGTLLNEISLMNDYDAMRYLFYIQNQLADHFKSNDEYGDNALDNIVPFPNYMITSRYTILGSPPSVMNHIETANECFNFTIRATATLFDWFARRTNQPQIHLPTITSMTCNQPNNLIYRNETATFNCYPYDPSYTYTWTAKPCGKDLCQATITGITTSQNGSNWFKISNSNYQLLVCEDCETSLRSETPLYYQVKVTATNSNGTSDPFYYTASGTALGIIPTDITRPYVGCPYVYVQDESGQFISDNNILHKSEFTENVGFDISDKYLLNVKPGVFDNKISMNLFESTHDISSINSIKLLAVDHPVGTKIGVTENNDIIMYFDEDVESPKNADRNHIENITQYVQYNNPRDNDTVSGIPTDDIYNNFDEEIIGGRIQSSRNKFNRLGRNLNRGTGDSVALIMRVGLNENVDRPPTWTPVAKRPAGNVTLTSDAASISTQFARRESPSLIIIPFGTNTSIEKADINWERDFSMSFAAVVDVFYSGFDVSELPLSAALNSANYDLLEDLQSIDGYYVALDTSGIIMLQFDNVENNSGMIRDYVLVTDGQYAAGTPVQRPASIPIGLTKNAPDNVLGFTNKLNANFPNPFNPTTKINYQIKRDGFVSLKIYNVVGQLVKELVGEFKNAGNYIVEFNGS
ncbi:MAG: hypothetical protein J0M18_17820, partial [Ignavibacteria bacterium]|nr:hypothetical protein [Ignavibacteria bacterium]